MKKIILPVLIVAILTVFASCGSVKGFSDVMGKEWKLVEVRTGDKDTAFNRSTLSKEGASDIFTMKIEAELLSGVGASNRFTAPYTLGEGQSIEVQPMRATLMAPLRQPEKLREDQFFTYLQNTTEWQIADKTLEFHSKTNEGAPIVLVFSR